MGPQRHDEQPRSPILAALRIAHHRAGAVIDLCFLARRCRDHHAGFGSLCSAQLAHEALHTLGAVGEAVPVDQVLVDSHSIAAVAESQFDGFAVRLTGAGAGTALRRGNWRRRKSVHFVSWEGVEVGDHLVLAGSSNRLTTTVLQEATGTPSV